MDGAICGSKTLLDGREIATRMATLKCFLSARLVKLSIDRPPHKTRSQAKSRFRSTWQYLPETSSSIRCGFEVARSEFQSCEALLVQITESLSFRKKLTLPISESSSVLALLLNNTNFLNGQKLPLIDVYSKLTSIICLFQLRHWRFKSKLFDK